MRSLRIAFVCDFFYPRLGGVEMHLWSLAQHLLRLGHKVIVITHSYGQRKGVRWLPGPLKVYYCPLAEMTDQDTLPTFTASLPLLRWIFLREKIQLVHGHQATSVMANESLVYAGMLGLASVYTDHSLFGFDDVASIVLNRVLQATLCNIDAAICVSHTCRDNLILRAKLSPRSVVVIPNALDPSKFTPDPLKRDLQRIKIVVVSRLVYRKGVDLLVEIIPRICNVDTKVDFIIGGDGSKRLALQEMVEREGLQDRVEFLGAVPHSRVRSVLCRGHIFLNCSLTESFCIAILEAASCGLLVVSTNVGGVPEVLPEDLVFLSDPQVSSLVRNLKEAIVKQADFDPFRAHERIKQMYSWSRVATETVEVYRQVLTKQSKTLLERLGSCFVSIGAIAGSVVCLLLVSFEFLLLVIEWWQPQDAIDVLPDVLIQEDHCIDETTKLSKGNDRADEH